MLTKCVLCSNCSQIIDCWLAPARKSFATACRCSNSRFNDKTGKHWWNINALWMRLETCLFFSLGFAGALKNSSRKVKASAKLESQWHEITASQSLLCLFRELLIADRFEDEFDFSLRDFCSSADNEDVRGSSYCRFASELLISY